MRESTAFRGYAEDEANAASASSESGFNGFHRTAGRCVEIRAPRASSSTSLIGSRSISFVAGIAMRRWVPDCGSVPSTIVASSRAKSASDMRKVRAMILACVRKRATSCALTS